jgi:hypothetical protein
MQVKEMRYLDITASRQSGQSLSPVPNCLQISGEAMTKDFITSPPTTGGKKGSLTADFREDYPANSTNACAWENLWRVVGMAALGELVIGALLSRR